HYPQPGWAERSTELLWQSTAAAIRTAINAAGIRPAQIIAIGTCGHGNGIYLLDRQGAPARPGILSMDTRANTVVADWQARGVLDAIWPRILQTPYAGQPPALLRWIKLHEPGIYARIGAALPAKDYIKYRLTGTQTTDLSDISATGLIDPRQRDYAPELLDAYGISEIADALPPIIESSALAGRVTAEAARATGLAQGTPVVGGMFDVNAGALGAGVIAPGQACMIAGTWSVNAVITSAPITSRHQLFNALNTPTTWLTIDASPTSTANLEWFVAQFCAEERAAAHARGVSVYQVCGEQIATLAPAGTSIIFHPFLYGSNFQPAARAGFYGLAGWHTRTDMLRALYEGVVYGHLSQIENLLAAGARVDSVRLIGGGARSLLWSQMFADVLDLPLEVPHGTEIGACGAALCAGIGTGVYADYANAATRAVTIERIHAPDPAATARYRAAYAEYQRLTEAMRDPWERLQQLADGRR
ncbi:MAG: FGGY-family carbohydrate kinase, partial [Roseiflexaceae bacterium]